MPLQAAWQVVKFTFVAIWLVIRTVLRFLRLAVLAGFIAIAALLVWLGLSACSFGGSSDDSSGDSADDSSLADSDGNRGGAGGRGEGGDGEVSTASELLGRCIADQVAASLGITIGELSSDLDDSGGNVEQTINVEVLRIARDICELREIAEALDAERNGAGENGSGTNGSGTDRDGAGGSGGAGADGGAGEDGGAGADADGANGSGVNGDGSGVNGDSSGVNGDSNANVVSPEADRDASLPTSLLTAPERFNPDSPAPGTNPALDELWLSCGSGEPLACDRLLYESPADSDYEAFGFSCGGRENLDCNTLLSATELSGTGQATGQAGTVLASDVSPATPAPGDRATLDGWWTQCARGSSRACAELVLTAPGGSLYSYYGYACGGRTAGDCAALLGNDGSPPALVGRSPSDPAPGTDAYLDRLWQRCAELSATACGDLATFAPRSSDYERFGLSCGWRAVTPCTKLFAQLAAR